MLFQQDGLEILGPRENFGPEIAFGHTLSKKYPQQMFGLIKYGPGGSSLASHWNLKEKGVHYERFVQIVEDGLAAMRELGYKPEVVAMLWTQGERDAITGTSSEHYQAGLKARPENGTGPILAKWPACWRP